MCTFILLNPTFSIFSFLWKLNLFYCVLGKGGDSAKWESFESFLQVYFIFAQDSPEKPFLDSFYFIEFYYF